MKDRWITEPADDELEAEGEPEEPQVDTIFVRDGKGRVIRLEVPDDD